MKLDLLTQIRAAGLPEPTPEFRFHHSRRWRFDWCFPAQKVALEIQGATFAKGRHTRGVGYRNDCVKGAEAQLAGWLVLAVTTGMVADGSALALVARALAARPA